MSQEPQKQVQQIQQKTNDELLNDISRNPNKSKAYLKRQGK
jgi:hypothetical protein